MVIWKPANKNPFSTECRDISQLLHCWGILLNISKEKVFFYWLPKLSIHTISSLARLTDAIYNVYIQVNIAGCNSRRKTFGSNFYAYDSFMVRTRLWQKQNIYLPKKKKMFKIYFQQKHKIFDILPIMAGNTYEIYEKPNGPNMPNWIIF